MSSATRAVLRVLRARVDHRRSATAQIRFDRRDSARTTSTEKCSESYTTHGYVHGKDDNEDVNRQALYEELQSCTRNGVVRRSPTREERSQKTIDPGQSTSQLQQKEGRGVRRHETRTFPEECDPCTR